MLNGGIERAGPPLEKEIRLWLAVLAQASSDLTGVNTFGHRGTIRYFARLWVESDNRDAGSFLWICDQLELDSGWLRRRLLEMADRKSSVSMNLASKT
jgi:hypothetical protein